MLFQYLGPYYVYALIDPETCIPFYIGKGKTNRLVEHFRKSGDASSFDKAELVGISPEELLEVSGQGDKGETAKLKRISPEELLEVSGQGDKGETAKLKKLDELEKKNFGPQQIARVICRRVTEEAAFAIEACLIKSVYGLHRLTNVQDGHHTERYRPHHPDRFEPDIEDKRASGSLELGTVLKNNEYYVYALTNPKTRKIFYVGKGRGERVRNHFYNAQSNMPDDELSDKLAELRALLNDGYAEDDIAHILAGGLSEDLAFLIESLFIRFVYGYARLTNVQPGHYSHLFRAHGDWELRTGLDIPIVVKKGQPRDELRDDFFGQDIHLYLYKVRDALLQDPLASGLVFSPAKVEGAGELCIDATIDNLIRLRIQSRGVRRVQVSLVGTGKSEQEAWLVKHFSLLQKFPYQRSDFRFSPFAWRGAKNVTSAVSTAVARALILIRIARAKSLNDLPAEIRTEVLSDYPYPRQLTAKERKILGL
ncbi:MAG: GIY-YIG nuclease family protein [Burkholderiales bacterium]|nr:GIY-YIG nuclease family protein [Burkholderiales bacterium]